MCVTVPQALLEFGLQVAIVGCTHLAYRADRWCLGIVQARHFVCVSAAMRATVATAVLLGLICCCAGKSLVGNPAPEFKAVAVYQVFKCTCLSVVSTLRGATVADHPTAVMMARINSKKCPCRHSGASTW